MDVRHRFRTFSGHNLTIQFTPPFDVGCVRCMYVRRRTMIKGINWPKTYVNVHPIQIGFYMNRMYIESNGTYPLYPEGMYRFTYQVYTDSDWKIMSLFLGYSDVNWMDPVHLMCIDNERIKTLKNSRNQLY
jgi:hypothetical protein